jgi:hypothetical protein
MLLSQKCCPVCGQGWVVPFRVISTREIFQLCLECEAVWGEHIVDLRGKKFSDSEEDNTFNSLVPFLESRGLKLTSGVIEELTDYHS